MNNTFFRNIYCGIVLLLSLFFIFPVSYLLYIHSITKDSDKEVLTYQKEIRELSQDNDKTEKLLS